MLPETIAAIKIALDAANLLKIAGEFWDRFRREPTPDEASQMTTQASSDTEAELNALSNDPQLSALDLSGPIVLAITGQIANITNRMAAAESAKGVLQFAREEERVFLRRELCFFLKELNRYAGGKLPTNLTQSWTYQHCEEFFPP
jgi:hypothetical protein